MAATTQAVIRDSPDQHPYELATAWNTARRPRALARSWRSEPGRKGSLDVDRTGPSPVDRGRPGSKHDVLVDGGGVPLVWTLTGGNGNDVTELLELLDGVRPAAAG